MNKTKKIGIVGAGPAGLSAAYFLRKKGYEDIILLEKNNEVGGKCNTVIVDDKPYEMGAGVFTKKSKELLSIQQSLPDIRNWEYPVPKFMMVDLSRSIEHYCTVKLPKYEWIKFFLHMLNFNRNVSLDYTNCKQIYNQPFQQWLRNKKINLVDILGMFISSYGYGYLDEVPTSYFMRYFNVYTFFRQPLFTWLDKMNKVGFQDYWKKVAESFSVVFNTEIQEITRGDKVAVVTNQGNYRFDYLIYACPLDETLKFVGTSSAEKAIFSQIYYYDYHSICATFDGMPDTTQLWPIKHHLSPSVAKWQFLFRPWLDTNVAVAYVLGKRSLGMQHCIPTDTVIDIISRDLGTIGINVRQVHTSKTWKYFPHFDQTALNKGIYQQLAALQGVNNTFYTGELLNFPTNEHVIRYSKHLVEKFF